MAADQLPMPGQVWALPHLHREPFRRGRVVILSVVDQVRYRYVARNSEHTAELAWFLANYDKIADSEQEATDRFGPQLPPMARRLVDMPISLGTAVK